jgi:tetratricopeptide (TPR) repeat protein
MNRANTTQYKGIYAMTCALALVLVAGCGSAPTTVRSTPARIEVQQDVGFTIIEERRVSNEARLDYDEALHYLRQGNLERGIEILNAVVANSPELAAPRIDLGIAQHLAGDLDAAESSFVAALKVNPGHPIALNELGILYRKSGRFAEARKSYEAALATYPGYHYARRNLAVLCDLYLADPDCALANYEAYMATVPADDEASMWMADLRYRTGEGE